MFNVIAHSCFNATRVESSDSRSQTVTSTLKASQPANDRGSLWTRLLGRRAVA